MKLFRLTALLLMAFILTGTANTILAQQTHISYSEGESLPDDSTKNYFELAYKEIENMLEGKDSLNYERAVFITENAYWDNRIEYENFKAILDFHTRKIDLIAKEIKEANRNKYATLRLYEKKMFDPLAANAAIHRYMTGNSLILADSQAYVQRSLSYSKYDPYGTEDWTNSQVLSLLNPYRETGNCYAWAALFKIYSERLQSDAYISTAPHHVYIQHRDIRGNFYNIELPTRTFPGDGTIETLTYTTREGLKNRIAMRKLNLKESIVLCLIYLAKGYEYKFGEYDANFSLRCSNLALKHDSLNLNAMLLRTSVMEESLAKYMKRKNIGDITQLRTVLEIKDLFSNYEKWISQLHKLGYREIPSDVQDILLAKAKGETVTNYKDYTPDPFPSLNVKDVRSYTLSGGMFDEVHLPQKFMQYGRTVLDTETGRITKIIKEDSTRGYKVDPVVFALSLDPIMNKYPGRSPYLFANNSPILFVDEDGLDGRVAISGNVITLETTIFIYGANASVELADKLNSTYAALGTCKEVDINGKTYQVNINAKFVYKESLQNSENINKAIKSGQDFIQPFEVEKSVKEEIGFQKGDNLLEVSARNVSGGTLGAVATQGYNTGYAISDEKVIIHETFHFFGYDERYNPDTKKPHEGFEGDVLSNGFAPAKEINSLHFLDLANFAIKKSGGQDTPANQPIMVNFQNTIDNTKSGRAPTTNSSTNNNSTPVDPDKK